MGIPPKGPGIMYMENFFSVPPRPVVGLVRCRHSSFHQGKEGRPQGAKVKEQSQFYFWRNAHAVKEVMTKKRARNGMPDKPILTMRRRRAG